MNNFIKKELNCEVPIRVEGKERWISLFTSRDCMKEIKKKLSFEIMDSSNLFECNVEALQKSGKEVVLFSRSIELLSNNSNVNLFNYYIQFFDIFSNYCVHLFRSFYWNEVGAILFQNFITKKVSKEQLVEAIHQFSKPSKRASILEIGDYFLKVKNFEKRLVYLKNNFFWLGSTDPFFSPIMKPTQIKKFIQSFVLKKRSNFVRPVNITFNKDEKRFIRRYQEILYIKDKRDDYRREAFYYFSLIVQELARRFGFKFQDLGYLRPSEIVLIKDDKQQALRLIHERTQGYIVESIGK